MKRIFIICVTCLIWSGIVAQTAEPVFVQNAGSGEFTYAPVEGFEYSHHTNNAYTLKSLTVQWELSLLMGEPVVNGVYKWVAGPETPTDYLDDRDYILLECTPKVATDYPVYIKINPSVTKSGEDFGENTPCSPSWKGVFCTKEGRDLTTKVPDFSAQTAKDIWGSGFYITGVYLARQAGSDGYFDIINESPQFDSALFAVKQVEVQRLEEILQNTRDKYTALRNPYTLSVKEGDTVYTKSIRPVSYVNPFFENAAVLVTIQNDEFTASTPSLNTDVYLSPGWNKIAFTLACKDMNVRDTVSIFYNETESFIFRDYFNDDMVDKKWTILNEAQSAMHINEEGGVLSLNFQRMQPRIVINGPVLTNVDPSKPLVIEIKNVVGNSPCSSPNNVSVLLNGQYSFTCRKDCTMPEQTKLICDFENGTVTVYIDDELFQTYEYVQFDFTAGIQIGLSCRYSERWDIDEILIYQ